jgi:hypothetical protein
MVRYFRTSTIIVHRFAHLCDKIRYGTITYLRKAGGTLTARLLRDCFSSFH